MMRSKSVVCSVLPGLILVGVMWLSPMCLAQTRGDFTDTKSFPSGEVGERLSSLIEAVNSNDEATITSFIETHFTPTFRDLMPMSQHVSMFQRFYDMSRGFQFYAMRDYESGGRPGEYTVIVRNTLTEGWDAFVVVLEPDPPHRIDKFRPRPARAPKDADAPPRPSSESQIIEALRAHVEKLARNDAFSGTLLLAKDGRVLLKEAYGLASKRYEVPNKIDTKFNLGSMNKMFTAVAVLQLAQRGKLSLDDPLSRHLSTDWLPREITDQVAIEHLLTHTSGLGSYFNEEFQRSSRSLYREVSDYKPLLADESLAFPPGTQSRYSNTGFLLLGAVIEAVTGQRYYDYVREHIYKPAGMRHTDCYPMDRPIPNLAMGYARVPSDDGPAWMNNLYEHVIMGGPAGGGFSTVEDLLRFDTALRSHKLLDAKHTGMLWERRTELRAGGYGLGFVLAGEPGNRIVGHGGGFIGINANLDMFLDSGYTAVVMSNYDRGAHPIMVRIRELLGAAAE